MPLPPTFVKVDGVGIGAYARDKFDRVFRGVESATERDTDAIGECCVCGQPVYIGWHLPGGKVLYCYDCPKYLESARSVGDD